MTYQKPNAVSKVRIPVIIINLRSMDLEGEMVLIGVEKQTIAKVRMKVF